MAWNQALNVAATGLNLFDTMISVTANNISGQGVIAFKSQFLVASDLPYETYSTDPGAINDASGTIRPAGLQIGMGVKPVGTYRVFTRGDLISTGRPLDLAIDGQGFFKVLLSDGTSAYTRAGVFERNAQTGQIVNSSGYTVSPGISIPQDATSIQINDFGQVYVIIGNQTETPQLVGQIDIVNFMNPSGLKAYGDNLYQETMASGSPNVGKAGTGGAGLIKQTFTEGSNVNPIKELTDLIRIEKIYGFLTRVINAIDSMADSLKSSGRG